jgi:hypothetical protein
VLNRLRKRLSYANIIASLALFIALGGVSYAATASKNSVKSSSIKDGQVKAADLAKNAVTSVKIKDGNVLGADLGNNSVSTTKIANGTIGAADLSSALTTDLNDAATLGGQTAGGLQTSALQAKQSGILTLTGTEQAAASLNLPAAGTYVVSVTAKAEASNASETTANIDVILRAGGTAIITEQAIFRTDVPVIVITAGQEPVAHQEVFTTTGAVTLTLGANTHAGNNATTTQLANGVITAVKVGSATGATPIS